MLVAVDAGRAFVKTVVGNRKFLFPSKVSKARKRTFVQTLEDDIEITYQGKDYFIGQLAEREGSFTRQMMTESKVNTETLLLILTALFKAGAIGDVYLVTGVPINMYRDDERAGLRSRLEGEHEIILNGTYRKINIRKVAITIEGGAAYWVHRRMGTVRIVDPGARTTNYATFKDGVFIDRESGTIPKGWDNVREADPEEMAAMIVGHLGGMWDPTDVVELIGGKAHELLEPFKREGFRFTTAFEDPQYANALGYYALGKELLGNHE
jgi:plasmid segregation protein ParM